MGAGAGVTISSGDLGEPYMDGTHLHIPLESAHLDNYEWACDCTGYAGELVVVGFDDEMGRLGAEDIEWREQDFTRLVRNRGIKELDGYTCGGSGPVEFLFGGGYIVKPMEAGTAYEVNREIGLGFGVDVVLDITVRCGDGSLEDVDGYTDTYPGWAVFVPSQRMAELYGFCCENWYEEDSEWEGCIDVINNDSYSDDPRRAKPSVSGNRKRAASKPSSAGGKAPAKKKPAPKKSASSNRKPARSANAKRSAGGKKKQTSSDRRRRRWHPGRRRRTRASSGPARGEATTRTSAPRIRSGSPASSVPNGPTATW